MSYEVLARKWRPSNFEELVGQEHVRRVLVNALDEGRLHHAYLFTGTRGVGKTTIARIFAKALNCEQGVTSKPCGECGSCREIADGRFIDLIEVDAASRTGVDDTRELLENVQYTPSRGRYKVYLIDEVHMFSKASFNALLKTLEEPPPHVKFLLATTDPQKLPVTVLSRCLQFNLKRLPISLIISHLQEIMASDQVKHDLAALQLLAEGADGSMRDALSLLDQALAFGDGVVQQDDVREMMGTLSRDKVLILLKALLSRDAAATMAAIATLDELAPDYENVLSELLSLLHHMALAKKVPEALDEYISEREALLALCDEVSAEDLQLFYQIALIGKRDIPLAPNMRSGMEMVMLRMLAFRPATGGKLVQQQVPPAGSVQKPVTSPVVAADSPQSSVVEKQPTDQYTAASATGDTDWRQIIDQLSINGMAKQLAANCVMQNVSTHSICLALDAGHQQLRNTRTETRLQQALCEYFDRDLRLELVVADNKEQINTVEKIETPAQSLIRENDERQKQAEKSIEEDSFVQALKETFNAEVVPGTVKPVSEK